MVSLGSVRGRLPCAEDMTTFNLTEEVALDKSFYIMEHVVFG